MKKATLEDVYDLWRNNLDFRKAFNQDPEAALKAKEFELEPSDLMKIKSLIQLQDKHSKDEELDPRINK